MVYFILLRPYEEWWGGLPIIEIANCLQVKTINVFLIIVFRIGLLPYLRLTTMGIKQDTLIEHKEAIIVCD